MPADGVAHWWILDVPPVEVRVRDSKPINPPLLLQEAREIDTFSPATLAATRWSAAHLGGSGSYSVVTLLAVIKIFKKSPFPRT